MTTKQGILAAAAAAALFGQTPAPAPGTAVMIEHRAVQVAAPAAAGVAGPGAFTWVSAEGSFEAALVAGAPYSGDIVTETTQTLVDGNRIKHSSTTPFARDGEGRTRRETVFQMGGESRKTIFIHDPVASVDYILDPQQKTARKIKLPAMRTVPDGRSGEARTFTFTSAAPAGVAVPDKDVLFERRVETAHVSGGAVGAVIAERMPLAVGVPPVMTAGTGADVKREQLGSQAIEGVQAEGTRTTITIPAGQIGNERPILTVSERWFSDELKAVVRSSRTDPRTGESSYRLMNVQRGEPSRTLFEVPPDYRVIEEGGPGMMRMRVEKKD